MESIDKQKDREINKAALNALLQKSAGDIANLSQTERMELQRRCTREMINELTEIYTERFPGMNPLAALLRDEPYRRRTTQIEVAKQLGMSSTHFNKIISGHATIGSTTAKCIYRRMGIDGSFILENV